MAVGCLHGEMRKGERQRELAKFRRGEYRALLVSDVAARGLDVPECDGVIHLELPSGPESYAHRAGRTGRAGRWGDPFLRAGHSSLLGHLGIVGRLGSAAHTCECRAGWPWAQSRTECWLIAGHLGACLRRNVHREGPACGKWVTHLHQTGPACSHLMQATGIL